MNFLSAPSARQGPGKAAVAPPGVHAHSLDKREDEPWTHCYAKVNGLRFHYVEAGRGPLVVLLHGFPEFWYAWRHQIPFLAQAGFRVIAPDLRGYNETDKPKGVHPYRLERLVADVAGLIDQAGAERATLVGHDWGGAIAWEMAQRQPQRLDKLAILNAPHPAAFRRELRKPAQWLRSAYILFFQLPWLPEWLLQAGDYALLERTLRQQPVQPGAFNAKDIQRYRQALARPGARTATLNYYRAGLRYAGKGLHRPQPIQSPTLLLWGLQDPYLGVGMTEALSSWVPNLRVVRLAEASHWVQNDAPDQVNALLLGFLQGE
jgi:pimeloyl-ACP methyl ester carboxylesterase